MGAQSSHHEPLNVGGISGSGTTGGGGGGGLGREGSAPDFNRMSSLNNSHRLPKKKSSLASRALNPRNTIRKSIRKRREKRQNNKENIQGNNGGSFSERKVEGPESGPVSRGVGMDRLRRSFRDSFRKKKDSVPEASKPHQWQHDEAAVRAATCAFPVKYLGCVEVFESRGMQVCEEALKVLRASRRRPIRGMLHVSGDGLRVVDDDTKGLLVDQTIEKVSFCAPDRNHERGFSYICRDGTTRRWMCHGFVAIKETGERLSHAVGCAFAACLDKKQKRDKECGVTMSFDQNNSTFTRMGSFKQMSITDRLTDPQECKPNGNSGLTSPTSSTAAGAAIANPHAIARPHATPLMLQRQGSCRVFHHLNQSSPFKRQLSLRLNELPSNLERQRSHSLDTTANIFDLQGLDNNASGADNANNSTNGGGGGGGGVFNAGGDMNFLGDACNNNGAAYGGSSQPVSSIPEAAPATEEESDAVSAMCQQLSQGLTLLSSTDHYAKNSTTAQGLASAVAVSAAATVVPRPVGSAPFSAHGRPVSPKMHSTILVPSVEPIREEVPWSTPSSMSSTPGVPASTTVTSSSSTSKAEQWLAQLNASTAATTQHTVNGSTSPGSSSGQRRNPPLSQLRANTMGGANQPQPQQQRLLHQQSLQQQQPQLWNPAVPAVTSVAAAYPPLPAVVPTQNLLGQQQQPRPGATSVYHPQTNFSTTLPSMAGQVAASGRRLDPFDSEWVSLDGGAPVAAAPPPIVNPNNPFLPANSVTKAFEVQM